MASETSAALALENVRFEVNGARLVDGVSVTIEPGQVVGILGPNGAGKSTLLKIASGELKPTEGRVLYDGVLLANAEPACLARRRAVVPQSSALTFPFTALEVVMLGVSVPGFGHSARAFAEGEQALERVGLAYVADRKYTDLSGGERQRVHIARAMCQLATAPQSPGETPILLVDEPTSNLDIAHQRSVLGAVREMAGEGTAVLSVLHDINLAAGYCDRLVLMRAGTVLATGSPHEIVRDDLLSRTYGCTLDANATPSRTPFVLPITRDVAKTRAPAMGGEVS